MFGGLDILAVGMTIRVVVLRLITNPADAIHHADGSEYILEVNDTSIGTYNNSNSTTKIFAGLSPEHEDEDNGFIRDLVMEKWRKIYG